MNTKHRGELVNKVGKTIRQYHFQQVIGGGTYGCVYKCKNTKKKEIVAIKVMSLKIIQAVDKLKQLFDNQIKVGIQCNNPNVVKFHQFFNQQNCVFIVMQFCNQLDLARYLYNKRKLSQQSAIKILKQIINGFKGLREIDAVHRDFKAQNIFINDGIFKIGDLGFTKILQQQQTTTTKLGTYATMAPQIGISKYTSKVDIWSIGCVYYFILTLTYPSERIKRYQLHLNSSIFKNYLKLSNQSIDFLCRCLTISPQKRMNWDELFNHPLVKQQQQNKQHKNQQMIQQKRQQQKKQQIKNEQKTRSLVIKNQPDQQLKDFTLDESSKSQQSKNKKQNQIQKTKQGQITNKTSNDYKVKVKQLTESIIKNYTNQRNKLRYIFINQIQPIMNKINFKIQNKQKLLFLLCKNTFIQIKQHLLSIQKYQNFLNQSYFDYFKTGNHYQEIIKKVKKTLFYIQQSLKKNYENYKKIDQTQANKIADYQKINQDIASEQITKFIKLLIDQLKNLNNNQKRQLLKLIATLLYYKNNYNNFNIQKYYEFAQGIIRKMSQQNLQNTLIKLLQNKM